MTVRDVEWASLFMGRFFEQLLDIPVAAGKRDDDGELSPGQMSVMAKLIQEEAVCNIEFAYHQGIDTRSAGVKQPVSFYALSGYGQAWGTFGLTTFEALEQDMREKVAQRKIDSPERDFLDDDYEGPGLQPLGRRHREAIRGCMHRAAVWADGETLSRQTPGAMSTRPTGRM